MARSGRMVYYVGLHKKREQTMRSPTEHEIRTLRERLGLTQTEAAKVMGTTKNVWQAWEYGKRVMPAIKWDYFKLKTKSYK